MIKERETDTISLAVQLLTTFLEGNQITAAELPDLILTTRRALTSDLGAPQTAYIPATAAPVEAAAAAESQVVAPQAEVEKAQEAQAAPRQPKHRPAVTVEASLASPKVIISMINGKPYKSLKSHITRAGLTPEIYRARYNLPHDYPMTAPEYSEQRSAAAIRLGYGRKPNQKNKPRADKPRAAGKLGLNFGAQS